MKFYNHQKITKDPDGWYYVWDGPIVHSATKWMCIAKRDYRKLIRMETKSIKITS